MTTKETETKILAALQKKQRACDAIVESLEAEIVKLKATIDRQAQRIRTLAQPLTAAERKILDGSPPRLPCDRPLSRGATGLDRMANSMRLPS